MYHKASSVAPRMLILPAALISASLLSVMSLPVLAQDMPAKAAPAATNMYVLEAGPLSRTLESIAQTSGRQIVYEPSIVQGKTAPAVRGNLSPGAAVAQAIAGTGYTLNEDDAGLLVITPTALVTIVAKRDDAETSFKSSRSDTATRSGNSLHLTPGAITQITSKVLETQQVTNVQDALRNVSGVAFVRTPQRLPTVEIRGFASSALSNGVNDSSAASQSVFAVERVEVLKGPQAILAGGDSLGGSVNIVMKKPQVEVIRDLTLQYGTGSDKTAAVDLSGPVTADKRLTYRTIASISDASRSPVGYDGRTARSFSQSLRWKTAETDFSAGVSYTKQHTPMLAYTFADKFGVILPIPDRLLSNAKDGFDGEIKTAYYQLEQQLNKKLTLVSRLQKSNSDFLLHAYSPAGLSYASPDAPIPSVYMRFYTSHAQFKDLTVSGDHYLRALFTTGELNHKLSVGFNHTDNDYPQDQFTGPSVRPAIFTSEAFEFPSARQRATQLNSQQQLSQHQRAVYVQDMMSYGKFNFLANLRRTKYRVPDSQTVWADPLFGTIRTEGYTTYSTTPGAGIVYQLSGDVALYASYAEGFSPQNSLSCSGGLVPPNRSRNKEIGAKFDLMDSKFSLTTSLFSLQQSNRLAFSPLENCYNVRVGTHTKGLEIDAQGRLMQGLDTVFNYSYTHIEDAKDPATAYAGQPKHKMSLWAVYQLQSTALKGFGVGIGVSASSHNLGSIFPQEQFTIPGQAQFDASIMYATGLWSLTLGVKNLADRTLYGVSTGASFVPVLPGREVMLTVKRSFR